MTIPRKTVFVTGAGLIVGLVAVALFAQSGSGAPAKVTARSVRPDLGEGSRPQLTRLQVDVFELRCAADQLLKVDLMELGQGADGPMRAASVDILERLRQLGTARLAIRYDNFLELGVGTRIASGMRVPTIKDIATAASDLVVPSVSYDDVGFVVNVKGHWLVENEPTLGLLDFSFESSGLAEQQLNVAQMAGDARLNLPIYQQFDSRQQLVVRQGVPVLLACNDLSKRTQGEGEVAVLVARLVATLLTE